MGKPIKSDPKGGIPTDVRKVRRPLGADKMKPSIKKGADGDGKNRAGQS